MAEIRIEVSERFDKNGKLYKKTIRERTEYTNKIELKCTHFDGDENLISSEKTVIKYEEVPDGDD